MSARVNIDWSAVANLADEDTNPDLRNLLDRNADRMKDDAQRYVPVDTGNLHDHIEVSAPEKNVRRVEADTDYAVHVEMGTENMAAQPYLRPALDGRLT